MIRLPDFRLAEPEGKHAEENSIHDSDIAIIGMAGRIGGADSLEEFWDNIVRGVDCVGPMPDRRKQDIKGILKKRGLSKAVFNELSYLKEIDTFDYELFGIAYKDACLMDPCHRLFLETVLSALEDGGYGGGQLSGTNTGLFCGNSADFQSNRQYNRIVEELEPESAVRSIPGNTRGVIGGRVAHHLNLQGPCMLVDTTCSSSLVALHLAAQSLRNRECDFAIAGGVDLQLVSIKAGKEDLMGIESSNQRTRSFDESSDGSGYGEGVAAILLRPLRHAIENGDHIYGILKGSAVNHDGHAQSLAAPNPKSQKTVLLNAWRQSGVKPENIGYLETHGSGTRLGDTIEMEAIESALREITDKRHFCAIGSVKTNIGHLGGMAGLAGVIKSVLSLKHGYLPPSIHFNRPNRNIRFIDSPVYVNDMLRPWPASESSPRFCGVSSFGMSGTNCHVVIQEPPKIVEVCEEEGPQVVVLSARTMESLQQLLQRYSTFLSDGQTYNYMDIAYTMCTGRMHYGNRIAFVIRNIQDLKQKVESILQQFPTIRTSGVYSGYSMERVNLTEETASLKLRVTSKANDLIRTIKQEEARKEVILEQICELYVQGADINWMRMFQGQRRRKVKLPTYPYTRTRCWIVGRSQTPHLVSSIKWDKAQRISPPECSPIENRPVVLLLRGGSEGRSKQVAELLRSEGCTVLDAEIGDAYTKVDSDRFTVGNRQEDYDSLAAEAKRRNVTQVYHLVGLDAPETIDTIERFQQVQAQGVDSLFYLTKALVQEKLPETVDLVLAGSSTYAVTGAEERLRPENAALYGLGRVVEQEYGNMRCRAIDVDEQMTAEELLAELRAEAPAYITVIRNGERYVGAVGEAEELKREDMTIHEQGVYLITGGTGGMGLEIAKYLASRARIRLVLLNRKEFPSRDQWSFEMERGEDAGLGGKIAALQAIERMGSQVYCYRADVGDEERLRTVLNQIRSKHGPIRGIVHSAGVAGDGFLLNKEKRIFDEVVDPKMRGTWLLDRLTEEDKPDFMVLFSSVTALSGAHGQGDYTAANAYLDAYSDYRNRQGKWTLSINWAAWKETGLALNFKSHQHDEFQQLSTREAVEAFDWVIQSGHSRVIIGEVSGRDVPVSPGDKETIQNREQQFEESNLLIQGGSEGYTSTEYKLAAAWAKVLGTTEISIYNNFYELGGDSMLAIHLLREMEKRFARRLDITDIYTYPTIKAMGAYIDEVTEPSTASVNDDDIDDLLHKLSTGELAVDDVSKLI